MSLAPSSFPRDAYAYACNQAGHAYLVGVPAALSLAWLGLLAPLAVAAIYAVAWELGYQRWRQGAPADTCTCEQQPTSDLMGLDVGC